ncbi:hypothetical protein CF326_g240 [Tilletia indica]|nr:hypothetical protein CF326_g240 [Tilletia indica]
MRAFSTLALVVASGILVTTAQANAALADDAASPSVYTNIHSWQGFRQRGSSRPTTLVQRSGVPWAVVLPSFIIDNGPLATTSPRVGNPPNHSPFVLGDSSSLQRRRSTVLPQSRGYGTLIGSAVGAMALDRYLRGMNPMQLFGIN